MYVINIERKRWEWWEYLCVFNQKWFWISTSCPVLWVRMPGRGSARLCSNSTTTKTTRNWQIAFLLYAHSLILERNSLNLTPWTRMVSKGFENTRLHSSFLSFNGSNVWQGEYWYTYCILFPAIIEFFACFFHCVHLWHLLLFDISLSLLLCVFFCVCVCSLCYCLLHCACMSYT